MKLRFACCTAFVATLALGAPAWAAKVTICHAPPGNPANSHTISVNDNALQAHLAHGDRQGECCPCWEVSELQSITTENQLFFASCFSAPGILALIQNFPGSTPDVEGGFAVFTDDTIFACSTRDLPPSELEVTAKQAESCAQQIRDRCEAIGSPIP
jgi:hypothetical protein